MVDILVKEFLENTKADFERIVEILDNNPDIIVDLRKKLTQVEAEQDDLLHEIELTKLNAFEKQKVYDKLKNVRERRRTIKDELSIVTTIAPTAEVTIKKGIFSELKQTIANLNNLESIFQNRKYKAKVREDLKCVYKKEEK